MTQKLCGCGRTFLKGMRALVSEGENSPPIQKIVCLRCARLATRLVIRGKARMCSVPECHHVADVCKKHVADAILDERETAVARAVGAVSALIAAYRSTLKREPSDIVDGRIEGLESALEILVQKGSKR